MKAATYALKPRDRSKTKSDYGTPWELIRAVEKRFGKITMDLAAHDGNAKSLNYYSKKEDSLSQDWHKVKGILWLNPPFANITPWAKKCQEEGARGAHILMLVPIGAQAWFRKYCWPNAVVYELTDRIQFEGAAWAYPKDCRLLEFRTSEKMPYPEDGFWEFWGWKKDERFY